MSFVAPVRDISFALNEIAGLRGDLEKGLFGDLSSDLVQAVLEEAGKFAGQEIAPLNRPGDLAGVSLKDASVAMPEGWRQVYEKWTAAGWGALAGDEKWGGQNLPVSVSVAVHEMWNAAAMAFGLGPILTHGASEAIASHASAELCEIYLPRMVSGEWTGTMNLTESHAGSDLSRLRARAERQPDGSFRITGTKIFITYGEHDLTENIIHLVLARLPDAPPGTRGISLFMVPKFLVNDDGSLGKRNDVYCTGLEHKLGIHASPTCTMTFGDNDGAVGYLVGEENRGLNCMFTMMNNARLLVGIQGVAIAERAFQQALAYARERRQGKAEEWSGISGSADEMIPIIAHPDVRRMLMTMKSMTAAARVICYMTGVEIDRAAASREEDAKTAASHRANILTPIAKAFATDIGVEMASIGVQVHGGMGFVEETGAAQYMRDARIAPIYEGTNGIQAIDLVTRKIGLDGGEAVRALITDLRGIAEETMAVNEPSFGRMGYRINEAVNELEEATEWMLQALQSEPGHALAGATPYQRLFGLAAGGAWLGKGALAAHGGSENAPVGAISTARYFAENHLTETAALRKTVTGGAEALVSIGLEELAG